MRCAVLALVACLGGCGPAASPPPREVADLDVAPPPPRRETPPPDARPAPRPPRAETPPPPPLRARARRYRGRPIDLDVRDADLVEVFRLLSTAGGVNLVVAPEVRGKVTLRLHQVPWDQAMDVIARAYHLDIDRDGSVWLVQPRASK